MGWLSGPGLERWSWIRIPLDLYFFSTSFEYFLSFFMAHKLALVLVLYHKEKLLRHSMVGV